MWYLRSPMDQLRGRISGSVVVVALAGVLTACGDTKVIYDGDAGVFSGYQGTVRDAGVTVDAGHDAGVFDAGVYDAGTNDAGVFDAGYDAGIWDAGTCEVTMCFTGAPQRGGSNAPFDEICDSTVVPNVIKSCDSLSCYNTFNTFGVSAKNSLYPNLFRALDTNGDNLVNAQDRGCTVNLLGYSWGGFAAIDVAQALGEDSRVDPGYRTVARVMVLDPYQRSDSFPFSKRSLTVPTNIHKFVEFRHSVSPANDCSKSAPFGPYEGAQPHCLPFQSCFDYNYSNSTSAYPTAGGGTLYGDQVGHCEVPEVAGPAVLAEFQGQVYTAMPPQVPVTAP